MSTKDEEVQRAKLAEQAERYDKFSFEYKRNFNLFLSDVLVMMIWQVP